MADNSRFWNRIAARYAKSPIRDEVNYQRKLEITRGYFCPDMHVLEIGCGTGSTAITHAPHVAHIRAVDIAENMLVIARDRAEAAGVQNVDFELAGIEDLDLGDDSYDMVLAHSILHLLGDKDRVLGDLYRALKPGGRLISGTACLGDGLAFIKWIAPVGRAFGLLPMVRVFTEAELIQSMTRAGFSIEQHWKPEGKKFSATFIVARKP